MMDPARDALPMLQASRPRPAACCRRSDSPVITTAYSASLITPVPPFHALVQPCCSLFTLSRRWAGDADVCVGVKPTADEGSSAGAAATTPVLSPAAAAESARACASPPSEAACGSPGKPQRKRKSRAKLPSSEAVASSPLSGSPLSDTSGRQLPEKQSSRTSSAVTATAAINVVVEGEAAAEEETVVKRCRVAKTRKGKSAPRVTSARGQPIDANHNGRELAVPIPPRRSGTTVGVSFPADAAAGSVQAAMEGLGSVSKSSRKRRGPVRGDVGSSSHAAAAVGSKSASTTTSTASRAVCPPRRRVAVLGAPVSAGLSSPDPAKEASSAEEKTEEPKQKVPASGAVAAGGGGGGVKPAAEDGASGGATPPQYRERRHLRWRHIDRMLRTLRGEEANAVDSTGSTCQRPSSRGGADRSANARALFAGSAGEEAAAGSSSCSSSLLFGAPPPSSHSRLVRRGPPRPSRPPFRPSSSSSGWNSSRATPTTSYKYGYGGSSSRERHQPVPRGERH